MGFTRDELAAATELVHRSMGPTPAYRWPLLSEAVGADVVVKHENHLPVGAFKVRGGLVYVDRLRAQRPHVTRLVSATRGNHGQSLAFAGRAAGLDVTIVVPHGNSPDKNSAMRSLGAGVVVHGHDFQAAREHATDLAAQDATAELVPSFHPDLVLGVATYAAELFRTHPDLDVVYVPVGMGSGICGLIGVRDLLGLPTEIVGVVSEGADATAEAMRLLLRTTHNVPEPAGAIALAGLCADTARIEGRRVGVVLTGGNADSDLLVEVLAGRTPVAAG